MGFLSDEFGAVWHPGTEMTCFCDIDSMAHVNCCTVNSFFVFVFYYLISCITVLCDPLPHVVVGLWPK